MYVYTEAGNTKGGSITVHSTSCLTSLDYSVLQIKTKKSQLSYNSIQTNQTGGQQYSDTSLFIIP
jgi:hypothetical protein